MTSLRDMISAEISRVEEAFDMEVLFACDYGSRTWGLEGPSSDFDIRMIYKDPPRRAFSLFNDRDMMKHEVELPDPEGNLTQVDLIGWSLPKALKLAQVSNPQILEFMASPFFYRCDDTLKDSLSGIAERFSPRIMGHYYRGLAKKNYLGSMVNTQKQDIKVALQTARCLMMSRWIVRTGGEVPPMNFNNLLDQSAAGWSKYHRENLVPQIQELVSLKVDQGWRHTFRHYPTLMNWAISEITDLDKDVMSLPDETVPGEIVEKAFQRHYPETFQDPEEFCEPLKMG